MIFDLSSQNQPDWADHCLDLIKQIPDRLSFTDREVAMLVMLRKASGDPRYFITVLGQLLIGFEGYIGHNPLVVDALAPIIEKWRGEFDSLGQALQGAAFTALAGESGDSRN